MKQTFLEFISSNFTLPVFVSLIVYKSFEIIVEKLLAPLISAGIDPHNKLDHDKLTIGHYTIDYGEAFKHLIVLFLIITIVYYLFRTK
jgi:large-conductance mechanosensitive channel